MKIICFIVVLSYSVKLFLDKSHTIKSKILCFTELLILNVALGIIGAVVSDSEMIFTSVFYSVMCIVFIILVWIERK